jgi:hypothetical protein
MIEGDKYAVERHRIAAMKIASNELRVTPIPYVRSLKTTTGKRDRNQPSSIVESIGSGRGIER